MNVKVVNSISEIPSGAWERFVPSEFPFVSYSFLSALEASGSVGAGTGWDPSYLLLNSGDELVAAMVLYSKTNSYGEYIFDFAWAQAYEHYGLKYYPKFLSGIPFTPATGPKVLVARGVENADECKRVLVHAALELASRLDHSSIHFNFIEERELGLFRDEGLMIRHSFQYHWKNYDYKSFHGFLARLRGKRRRDITRERSRVAKSGLVIERLTGDSLKAEHAEIMYAFYVNTVSKMGGYPYLTAQFFTDVFKSMKENILFVLASDPSTGEPVAGAINFFGSDTLFGRHWGSVDDFKFLHFELCYYQAIDFAIERGLKYFEAGAQGEHKFQRGFTPELTYSAHFIAEPRMSDAIGRFVEEEKAQIERLFEEYEEHSPFLADEPN